MPSPVIVISLLAAAASPILVSGAPASPQLDNAISHPENAASVAHVIRANPMPVSQVPDPGVPQGIQRRAGDIGTASGSAHSGATPDGSSGSVGNEGRINYEGTIDYEGDNADSDAHFTFSGNVGDGSDKGFGPGAGNAYMGASGSASGANGIVAANDEDLDL